MADLSHAMENKTSLTWNLNQLADKSCLIIEITHSMLEFQSIDRKKMRMNQSMF